MKHITTSLLLLRIALLLMIPVSASSQITQSAARTDMGVRFIPNRGQVVDMDGKPRPDIRYISRSNGMSLYLAEDRISYVFTQVEGDLEHHRHADGFHDAEHPEPILKLYRMDLELISTSTSSEITSDLPHDSYTSYYLPHIPDGITHVPSFGRVTYRDIYPSIDLVVHTSDADPASGLKYDFVVRPGGRVSDIRMRYSGATAVEIDRAGGLVTTTPLGTLGDDAPYTYQEMRSGIDHGDPVERLSITSRYRIVDGVISFVVDEYDTRRTLVIDPTQRWSTYYGGTGAEDLNGGDATEIDRSGNALYAGNTDNNSFPTTTGAFSRTVSGSTDAVVVKMSATGVLLWATVYGGTAAELAHGIVSDNDRNIFITGHTFSTNFPTFNAHDNSFAGGTGNRDAFVVKFDSNGTRRWSTYYGGTQFDDGYGFAIDSSGSPAMIGTTASMIDIATNGAFQPSYNSGSSTTKYDGFLVKFDGSGTRRWGTYIGGAETEYGYGAAASIDGNISITGWTNSSNLPVTVGAFQPTRGGDYDAFVMQFDSVGRLRWGTYFGGSGRENDEPGSGIGFAAITTDGEGSSIITGMTTGNLPTSSGAIQSTFGGGTYDAFIAKFDTQGRRVWSTYYGGNSSDIGQGIASTGNNGIFVTGHTTSPNLPGITLDSYQPVKAGLATTTDAFIVKLDSKGSTSQYATYYGGTGSDEGVGVSADRFGSILVAGTAAAGFPVTAGAFQTTYAGGVTDAFLAMFCDIEVGVSGQTILCPGVSITLFARDGYREYQWSRDGVELTGERSSSLTVDEGGRYTVRVVHEAGGCSGESRPVDVIASAGAATPTITAVGNVLTSSPARTYQWSRDGVPIPSATDRSYIALIPGIYTVAVTDEIGCEATSQPFSLTSSAPLHDIADGRRIMTLKPIHPDPADGMTSIEYEVAAAGRTRILLVDMLGRTTSILDAVIGPGEHIASFDASKLPSGTYLCILRTDAGHITRMLTIRQ